MNQLSPEQFLAACGARAPLQLEAEHEGRHETLRRTFPLPFVLVGRDERTDFPLIDKGISRRHVYLQVVAGRLWCFDLNSRTGTHWDRAGGAFGPLDGRQPLRVGPYTIRLTEPLAEAPSSPDPLHSDASDSSPLPRVSLDFLEGTSRQSIWTMDRVLTLLGRSPHCRVRMHSLMVSRTHCALLRTPAGLWLIDLLGRRGTYVNGMPVRWARLDDGDELRIGDFLIRIRLPDQADGGSTPAFLPAPAESDEEMSGLLSSANPMAPPHPFGPLPAELNSLLSSPTQLAPLPSALAPAGGGTNESLLLPVITQFSLMQQQMFDQFQQALMMMVQMFSTLHRDQMQLIRQELNQLHELTRELRELQTELTRHAPSTRVETVPSRAAATLPPPKPAVPAAASAPPAAARAPSAAPARPAPTPPPRAPVPTPSAAPPASAAPASPAASVRSDADVHAWLSQRLAALQKERQTLWQRILNTLTGKRAEEAVP